MSNPKKTFYEILAVSPGATLHEIQETYQHLVLRLQSQRSLFKLEEYELKLKIINLAFNTLSNPSSRSAYDAELAARAPAHTSALALQPDPASVALRAEAMSLRAEAISLRADALTAGIHGGKSAFAPRESGIFFSFGPALRTFLMLLGVLLAVWMVGQVVYTMMSNRQARIEVAAAASASEKIALQEYYQTHGVRPANKAELDLLVAEDKRKETERLTAERAKAKAEEESRRFDQESRRRAAEVSAELRRAENQAGDQARRDEDQRRYKADEQNRAERQRIEQERYRWQQALRR